MEKNKKREIYDEICKVLLWYEYPDECDNLEDEMYDLLVRVSNMLAEEIDYAD